MRFSGASETVKAAYAAAHRLRASGTDGPFWVYGRVTQFIILIAGITLIFQDREDTGVVFIVATLMIGVMRQLHRDMLDRIDRLERDLSGRMDDL